MVKVLILGANGQIARLATAQLVDAKADLRLFLRNANRLQSEKTGRAEIIDGDAANVADLTQAMAGVDVVYANLAGHNIEQQAKSVVAAMTQTGIKRLIWVSTLGIYDEVPGKFGQWNHQMLDDGYLPTYAAAAKVIETSELDYTIIRPAWLDNKDEVDYELTQKGEAFKGTEVSRKSVATYIVHLINNPSEQVRRSVGINKPNTDGDKPAWY
ncbi:oxidoreductase [Lapidilactobacillus dextrinicus DSM 20335]|uniref:Oxidoreductase n=1 Tax=Lapidilactobacillus dextrinicus DSM 20335 TaxID=1423738 RepID=A0A0R2BMF9_9LACO|nr:SDR family oxidoreductase [Lapidilactobacillus dextrinicus]KRM79044.1 oxidoreductase [Lapidilactobacillus dextrinicus DSM 20335]QFG46068.1 SDR family oxidoreductase [Lapidilactobacillus dextrinicus]